MTRQILLGLCGKMQSGKDTVFQILSELTPAVRLAFADAVKVELARACGVSTEYLNERKALFRPALQWWGTDFRRNLYGQDYWIKIAQQKLGLLQGRPELVVFTDVRFVNEVEFIRRNDGALWQILRPRPWRSKMKDFFLSAHSSECLSCDADEIVRNTGTLEDLKEAVRGALVRTERKYEILLTDS